MNDILLRSMKKKKKNSFVAECFSVFAIAILIITAVFLFKGVWPFGTQNVIWADMTHAAPFFYSVRDILRGQDSFIFSWRYGGGLEFLGILAQQGMLSPVNLILLFFKRENIYGAIGILIAVKISLQAVSMYIYLDKYTINKLYKLIGALGYAFGMSSMLQAPIVMTLDVGIIFPLLTRSMEDAWENKRKWLYPVILAISMATNLYINIMVVMYIVIAVCAMILTTKDKETKNSRITYMVKGSLLGLAASAPIWVAVFVNYMNSSRFGSNNFINTYLNAIKAYTLPGQRHLVWINLTFFVCLIILNIKGYKLWKSKEWYVAVKFIFMALAVFVPGIELLWHMGSHSGWPWRFCFIFQFALIDTAMMMASIKVPEDKTERICARHRIKVVIATVASLSGIIILYLLRKKYFLFSTADKRTFICFASLLVLYGVILISSNDKIKRYINLCIAVMFAAEIFFNAFFWISPNFQDRVDSRDMEYIFTSQKVSDELYIAGILPNQEKWSRTKDFYGNYPHNYAGAMNVNSISNWIHLVDAEQQETLRKLGYSTIYTRFQDNGGTVFSDAVLGFESAFAEREINSKAWLKREEITSVNWYDLKYKIPKVIGFNADIGKTAAAGSVFELQNRMFKDLTGNSKNLFEEINYYSDNDGTYIFNVNFSSDSELYICADDDIEQIRLTVNGQPFKVQNLFEIENELYPIDFNSKILDLGSFSAGDSAVVSIEPVGQTVEIDKINISVMDYTVLEEGFENIGNSKSKYNLTFNNTGVELTVSNCENSYLYIPVLYADSWMCRINGEKCKIENYNGFIAIPVPEKDMNIKLTYLPQGYKEAICIFVLLSLMAAIVMVVDRLFSNKIKNFFGVTVTLGAVIFVFFVYLLPVLHLAKHYVSAFL